MTAGATTRALAARALERILRQGETLDAALGAACSGEPDLEDRDRAQAQALAYGAVRWHHRHRALLKHLLDRPLKAGDRLLEALLSVGLFQLADPEQPDYAAVSATVAAARLLGHERAAGLVNATLRRYQREAPALLATLRGEPAAWYSHPDWLLQALQAGWPDCWQAIAEANQRRPPLWLRVNRLRTTVEDYAARLGTELGVTGTRLPDFPDALKLDVPLPVQRLPGFAEGLVSVQDAASQRAALLLAPEPGMRVLDACAAPGGKTTHLLEFAAGELDLTAIDLSAGRLTLVEANLQRLGLRATLLAGDATEPGDWWDGRPFDRILVDAPCSATGVLRRHPDIKLLRRASDLPGLAARQELLLRRLWPLLRPGGRLLYSTCSVLPVENAAVVAAFRAEPGPQAGPVPELVQELQLLPGTPDTDGFYYALMNAATH